MEQGICIIIFPCICTHDTYYQEQALVLAAGVQPLPLRSLQALGTISKGCSRLVVPLLNEAFFRYIRFFFFVCNMLNLSIKIHW